MTNKKALSLVEGMLGEVHTRVKNASALMPVVRLPICSIAAFGNLLHYRGALQDAINGNDGEEIIPAPVYDAIRQLITECISEHIDQHHLLDLKA